MWDYVRLSANLSHVIRMISHKIPHIISLYKTSYNNFRMNGVLLVEFYCHKDILFEFYEKKNEEESAVKSEVYWKYNKETQILVLRRLMSPFLSLKNFTMVILRENSGLCQGGTKIYKKVPKFGNFSNFEIFTIFLG